MNYIDYDGMIKRIGCKLDNRVYTSWKGQNIIKTYTRPRNTKFNDKQLLVQKAFREVGVIWKSIPEKLKASWLGCSDGLLLTDYSIFVKSNLCTVMEKKPGTVSRSTGIERIAGMTASSSVAGTVEISYPALPAAPKLSVFARLISESEGFRVKVL